MEDWINAGSGSIWTQAVKSVVVKWDGGYLNGRYYRNYGYARLASAL